MNAADFELCCELHELIGRKRGGDYDIGTIPKHERIVVLVWHATGIIENGGFQYLFEGNFPGDPAYVYTAAAFRFIGCDAAAEAFEEALALFPDSIPPPGDADKREAMYLSVDEKTRDRIDMKFWDAMKDVEAKLAAYIRANHPLFDQTLR